MAKVPTRCTSIDNAIGGGFALGRLSEVCDESGVGKTQLCLQLVATAISDVNIGGLGGSAIYISCVTPFPRRRLEQMVADLNPSAGNLLSKVTMWRGSTPYDLKNFVDELGPTLKADDAAEKNYKVIVIDTMFGLVTHHFPDTEEGFEERAQVIRAVGFGLKQLARKNNVAIIACNNVVDLYGAHINAFTTSGRRVKPGIGIEWDKNLYVRYVMAKESVLGHEGWVRTFQIFDKGQYYARCMYKITEKGVCSA